MTIAALKESRASKIAEMKALGEKPDAAKFDALETETRAINAEIKRAETLAELERMEATPANDNETRQLTEGFSVAKAIREASEGKLTGREAEYAQEQRSQARSGAGNSVSIPTSALLGETRALKTTTPGAGPGGNLVATDLASMTDRRRPALKVESLGATVLRNLSGNLDLPRLAESGTATWVAEHNDASRSDPKFSKKTMGPKTVSAEYEVSRRMLLQSQEDIETILRMDLGKLLATALDAAAIKGGGPNEPVGILADGTVQSIAASANFADTTADLIAALETDDVSGTTAFLTNPAVMAAARKMRDADGRSLGTNELFHQQAVEWSTQVPGDIGGGGDANALIFAEWASLFVGYFSSVDILVNPYHTDVASKGGVLLHAFLDADVVVRNPEAFAYSEIA